MSLSYSSVDSFMEQPDESFHQKPLRRLSLHNCVLFDPKALGCFLAINPDINIDEQNEDGNTALYFACLERTIKEVKLLVSSGANLDIANNDGYRPVNAAISFRKFDIVHFLVSKGASISERDFPLSYAIKLGSCAIVKGIIKSGAVVTLEHLGEASHKYKLSLCSEKKRLMASKAGAVTVNSTAILKRLIYNHRENGAELCTYRNLW